MVIFAYNGIPNLQSPERKILVEVVEVPEIADNVCTDVLLCYLKGIN